LPNYKVASALKWHLREINSLVTDNS
jgi:hypothetical protein